MKHIESYHQYNEGFDILSKIKDYLDNKLHTMSSRFIKGVERDLIHFAKIYNLSILDMRDRKKIELALLENNESFQPYPGYGQTPPPMDFHPHGDKENFKKSVQWVIKHPILHKLSKFTFLLSIISTIGQGVGLYFADPQSNLPVKLIISMVATIIAGLFIFILGEGTLSSKDINQFTDEDKPDIKNFDHNIL